MCGVLAFYNINNSISGLSVTKALEGLAHRGPDGKGIIFETFDNVEITLAHLRLSILDLTQNASQPFIYKKTSLIFNGEIYNYKELKIQLLNDGYVFKSESDTEVVILGYDKWGKDVFSKLNGMFSIILFDSSNHTLIISRDQLGIKPLFYYIDAFGSMIFSSEPKSIIDSGIDAGLNKKIISEFLQYRFRESNETFINSINEFPKGEIWEIKKFSLTKKTFKYKYVTNPQKTCFNKSIKKVETLLLESLERQTKADVPIGFFLSGGVDSSLLVSIYAKEFKYMPNTFSVYFNNYEHSEQIYQKIVSNEVQSNHIEFCSNHTNFFHDYIECISNSSSPHSIPNYTQVFQLAKKAKETVKVLISGEGADELFGGYHRYQHAKISDILNNKLLKMYKFVPYLNTKIKSILLNHPPHLVFKYGLEYLKSDEFIAFVLLSKCDRNFVLDDDFNSFLLYDQDVYLRGLLERVDNMTMLAGIEARVPYLDMNLVNFVNSLDFEEKVGVFERKRIIQKIAHKYLPKSIINRTKIGFSVPLDKWITEDFGLGAILSVIVDERSRSRNIFNYDALAEIIKHPDTRKKYSQNILFPALCLELWTRSVVEKEDISYLAFN